MTPKKKRDSVPLPPNFTFWKRVIEQLRLAWLLFLDSRVPVVIKVIPLVTLAYVLSPIDLMPDIFLLLGQLDDLSVFLIGITIFISLAAPEVRNEHLYKLRFGSPYRVRRDRDGMVIDVKAEPLEEGEEAEPEDDAYSAEESAASQRLRQRKQ